MTYLYPVWLFFSAFFFYFAYINWRQSSEDMRPFKFRESDSAADAEPPDPEIVEGNQTFVREFNAYLTGQNTYNRSRRRATAVGYMLAGLFSMVSIFLLLFP